jgi:DNA polymerase III subunit delta'
MKPHCVFDDLVGQERIAGFLRRTIEDGTAAHAYLFFGPPGSGKKSAAKALACALLCDDGGCGSCPACRRIKSDAHPDVRIVEPEGVTYIVEQVRDQFIPDVWLKPIEGERKVYIFDRADAFNDSSANAFLKTLEEPPPAVYFILLATVYDKVLPTIASRCQAVRFAALPPSVAIGVLAEKAGAGREEATAALAASGGVVPRALEFLRSPARRAVRERLIGVLRDLPVMDAADVLAAARELLSLVKAPLDEVKGRQEAELRERVEFLGKTAGSLKPLEERHKRELNAKEREGVGEILNVTESWLRDALAAAEGIAELIGNSDVADEVAEAGRCAGPVAVTEAIRAVSEARKRISYNVSPQLAVEVMLFDIQEALTCPR